MHAVAAIQGGVDAVGGTGFLDRPGDIEDGAEAPAVRIQSFTSRPAARPSGLPPGIDGAREGADRSGEDLQAGLASAAGQGPEVIDEGLGGGGRLAGHAGETEVIDAEVDQDVGHAGCREHVAVKARQRMLADLVAQQAVPGQALVHAPPRLRRRFRKSTDRLFAPVVEPTPGLHESPNATAIAVPSGASTSTPETFPRPAPPRAARETWRGSRR